MSDILRPAPREAGPAFPPSAVETSPLGLARDGCPPPMRLLWDIALRSVARAPWRAVLLLVWLFRHGRAGLKARLAALHPSIDDASLPTRDRIAAFAVDEHAAGRAVHVATAANGVVARLTGHPAVRFLVAGGLAAAINWLARFPFSAVLPFAGAIVAAQVVGWIAGFVLYRAFVFAPSGRPLRQEAAMFLLVNGASLVGVLAVALAAAGVLRAAGLDDARAEAVAHAAGIAAGAVLNFLGHRAFTFAPPGGAVAEH